MESPAHCDQYDHQAAGTRERAAVAPLRFDLFFFVGKKRLCPQSFLFYPDILDRQNFPKSAALLRKYKKTANKGEFDSWISLPSLSYPCFLPTCLVNFHMWILRFHIRLIKPLITVPIIQMFYFEPSNYFDLWYLVCLISIHFTTIAPL